MSESVLECRSVVRRFDEGASVLEVLSGVDLTINPAERVAIIGASGSGKTTLLQIMGGLDTPTSGEVLIANQAMHEMSEIGKVDVAGKVENTGTALDSQDGLAGSDEPDPLAPIDTILPLE